MSTIQLSTLERYLIDCIDTQDVQCNSDEQALQVFFDRFNAEFNFPYNKQKYPNLIKRVEEYLKGNNHNLAFENSEIISLRTELGFNPGWKDETVLSRYWYKCAFTYVQLMEKLGLPVQDLL